MPRIDLGGQRYGRLTVIAPTGVAADRCVLWRVLCDCGNEKIVSSKNLRSGESNSCGCFSLEVASARGRKTRTHGFSNTGTYASWCQMLARCYKPDHPSYQNYGGRGITVCERWRESVAHLVEDIGLRPEGLSLDRVDVNGNYEPSNCRWATTKEQHNNTRRNVFVEHCGQTMTVAQWAERVGIPHGVLRRRLYRGWQMERALSEPVRPYLLENFKT